MRILSADDDEGTRALLYSLLTESGHEVEFAKDGEEVFKLLGRRRHDLLILDINIPGMNGYKVAEKLCNNIVNRPRILLFTARDIERERFQFVCSGADAILRKGEPCDVILATIGSLFQETERNVGAQYFNGRTQGGMYPMENSVERGTEEKSAKRINEDLKHCISRLTQIEDQMNLKNMRYEEFIRDLLKEKQRTEKNYLEFKRIEQEVVKTRNWEYAVAALAAMALIKSFI